MINSRDVDEKILFSFIAEHNSNPESAVGYCGNEPGEIADTLRNDFSEGYWRDSFIELQQNGELTAVLGLDREGETAEVWGPFMRSDQDWMTCADQLWQQAIQQFPELKIFHTFYSHSNERAAKWIQSRFPGQKATSHYVMQYEGEGEKEQSSVFPLESWTDRDAFRLLHDSTFMGSYFDSADILERQSETNIIYVYKDHGKVAGYVYSEDDPVHNEASIEFVGVLPDYRGRGIGRKLIQHAVAMVPGRTLSICVADTNEGAVRLYESAGFQVKQVNVYRVLNATTLAASLEQMT